MIISKMDNAVDQSCSVKVLIISLPHNLSCNSRLDEVNEIPPLDCLRLPGPCWNQVQLANEDSRFRV